MVVLSVVILLEHCVTTTNGAEAAAPPEASLQCLGTVPRRRGPGSHPSQGSQHGLPVVQELLLQLFLGTFSQEDRIPGISHSGIFRRRGCWAEACLWSVQQAHVPTMTGWSNDGAVRNAPASDDRDDRYI